MLMNPMKPSFVLLMILSSLMVIQTKYWILIWIMMEINTLSFMFLLMKESKKEKILMFFLVQTMSSFILLTYISMSYKSSEQNNNMSPTIMFVSMFLKMGMFPFTPWIILVGGVFSWASNLMIMTWQKVTPILIICKPSMNLTNTIMTITSMSMMSVLMMLVSKIKTIFMLSSLIHTCWMAMIFKFAKLMPMMYLAFYSSILLTATKMFYNFNMKNTSNSKNTKNNNTNMTLSMLSMSGMPPLTGFFMKLITLYLMLTSLKIKWLIIFCLVIASISFFVYLKTLFKNTMMNKNNLTKKMNLIKIKSITNLLVNTFFALILLN